MADLTWRGVTLVSDPSAPANSPRWIGSAGRVRGLLEHNTVSNTWTAIVGVVGKPVSAASENADRDVAIVDAITALLARIDGPSNSRTATLVPADRNDVASVHGSSGGVEG